MSKNTNQVCVVTGGNSGIGLSICKRLLELEYRVSILDINIDRAIQEFGQRVKEKEVIINQGDVAKREDIEEAVEKTLTEYSMIHHLVCNAGILTTKNFLEEDEKNWDRVLSVNLKGAFLCCQVIAPIMIENKSGCIVNIAYKSGMQTSQVSSLSYNASKAGIIALSRDLAARLADYGIRVNCIAPGFIETPMTTKLDPEIVDKFVSAYKKLNPLKHVGTPIDIAYAVEFLISDHADFITGEILNINGGSYMP